MFGVGKSLEIDFVDDIADSLFFVEKPKTLINIGLGKI